MRVTKLCVIPFLVFVLFYSFAWGEAKKSEGTKPQIKYNVAKEAKVTKFDCFFKDYQKVKTLHYGITLKNTSNAVHRYRVMISIPGGDSVGGLLPASPKLKFEAGKEMSDTYPVLNCTKLPKVIEVTVNVLD
jgi:hypothetical protein